MEVISAQPGVPDLPLGGFVPNNEAIQIRNIDGLGPVKAEIATTGYATGRGELSTGSSLPKRNIVLTLGLNPNWVDQSMTSLRQLLYQYFMPQSRPHLTFYSDELPPVYIDGIVESFEPNIFSPDPQIQISFLGLRPEFIDIGSHEVGGPIVSGSPEATINYQGTLSAGFIVQIKAPTEMDAFSGDFIVRNTVRGINHDFRFIDAIVNTTKYVELNTQRGQRYLHSVPVDEDDPFSDIL